MCKSRSDSFGNEKKGKLNKDWKKDILMCELENYAYFGFRLLGFLPVQNLFHFCYKLPNILSKYLAINLTFYYHPGFSLLLIIWGYVDYFYKNR